MSEGMIEVPFTRYTRHGTVEDGIFRPAPIAALAAEIADAGFRFEVELLSTGEVSATITDNEGDHDIELWPNRPREAGPAVDRLITRFHAMLAARKKDQP